MHTKCRAEQNIFKNIDILTLRLWIYRVKLNVRNAKLDIVGFGLVHTDSNLQLEFYSFKQIDK